MSSCVCRWVTRPTSGVYKAILGEVVVAAVNLVLYGGANAGLSAVAGVASTPAGRIGRALASGAFMSIVAQGAITAAARNTLSRNEVGEAGQLPETAHNRTIPDGVYLRNVPAWHERTNLANKAVELAAHAIGMILARWRWMWSWSGAVCDGTKRILVRSRPGTSCSAWVCCLRSAPSPGRCSPSIFNDPAKHANKFGIAASDVLTSTIEASAMNRFEGMLDQAGTDIASGHWGPQGDGPGPAGLFTWASMCSAARCFVQRPLGLDDTLEPLLGWLRGRARELRDGQDKTLRLPIEGTLVKMADTLEAAAASLEAAGRAAGAGGDISPEFKDAKLRIRDLQGLLLHNMFQLGGPTAARDEARVSNMATVLLPLFAALRKADRMDLADAFITGVVDYTSGRRSARAVLARLGPGAHNRVKARDVAAKLKTINQNPDAFLDATADLFNDPRTFLGAATDFFTDLFGGKVPDYAASKLLMLANLLNKPATAPAPDAYGHATTADVTAAFNALAPFEFPPTGVSAAVGQDRPLLPVSHQDLAQQAAPQDTRQTFIDGVRGHAFSLEALRDAIDDLRTYAGRRHPRGRRVHRDAGPGETHPGQRRDDARCGFPVRPAGRDAKRLTDADHNEDTLDTSAGDLFESLWADTQAIPRGHGMLARAALSLPLHTTPVDLPTRVLSDAHFHPTSYSGKINSLVRLIVYMDHSGIARSNLPVSPRRCTSPPTSASTTRTPPRRWTTATMTSPWPPSTRH